MAIPRIAPDEAHLDRNSAGRLQAADLREPAEGPLARGEAAGATTRRVATGATVALAPFAALHGARGEGTAAGLHVAVIVGLALAAACSRRHARIGAWIAAASAVAGCMALVALDAAAGTRWAYAAVVAAFLLLRPGEGALVSAALIAAIALSAAAHASSPARIGFLVTASLVALGMHAFARRIARHDDELDALATRDPLTGAGNARALESELPLAVEAARRERRACGVAVLEVDHLEPIAERHGEDGAARVLVDLARVLDEATRRTDRLFRTGRGTFALLLPGADTAVLGPMLDSLRLRIGDALRVDGEVVSVSVGAAALRGEDDASAWLARAGAALEQARRAGRNRVEVCDCTVTADGSPMRAR